MEKQATGSLVAFHSAHIKGNTMDTRTRINMTLALAVFASLAMSFTDTNAATIAGVTIEDFSSQLDGADDRYALFTINGAGLTGSGHNVADGDMWLNTGTFEAPLDPMPSHVTYDLEANYTLGAIRVWNYNGAGTTPGAKDVEIWVSPTSSTGDLVKLDNGGGDFVFAKATGIDGDLGSYVDLSGVTNASLLDDVRLVRLNATTNYGFASDLVGLSEVRFDDAPVAPITVSSYVYDGVGQGATPNDVGGALPNFLDPGNGDLTDGLLPAGAGFDQPEYVGFRDEPADDGTSHPQITFDLGSLYDVHSVEVTYRDVEPTIQEPDSVFISVSSDGLSYSTPVAFGPFIGTGGAVLTTPFDVSALPDARYYRLDFRQGPDAQEWVLLAEVGFIGVAATAAASTPEPSTAVLAALGLLGFTAARRRRRR